MNFFLFCKKQTVDLCDTCGRNLNKTYAFIVQHAVRSSSCRPWLLCEVLYKHRIKTWFLPQEESPFPYQSWWQSSLSESKQTVRQHQCDRQQFHHLRSWNAVDWHSFKNRACLTMESRILFSWCVPEQGWRTQLPSVVKRWLDPEYACGEGSSWSFHRPEDMIHFLCGTECTSSSKHFSMQVRTWALGAFQKVFKCGRIRILPKSLKSVISVVKVWISSLVKLYF